MVSNADVTSCMARWGTPQDVTQWWLQHVHDNTYFVKNFIVSATYKNQPGIMIASSTATSNSTSSRNQRARVVLRPEWYDFKVWFYPHVVMFNVMGLWSGGIDLGSLEQVLDAMCQTICPGWRLEYAPRADEYHDCSFGRLLLRLGISQHLFSMAGLSFHEFFGLDLYTTLVCGSSPPPAYYAHDVAVSHTVPTRRVAVPAEDWWQLGIRITYGQRSCEVHWLLRSGVDVNVWQQLGDRYRSDAVETLRQLADHNRMDNDGLVRVLIQLDRVIDPDRMSVHVPMMQPLCDFIMQLINASHTGIPQPIAIQDTQDTQTSQDAEALRSRL